MAYIISCVGHEQAGKDTAFRWITALASPHVEVLRYAHADELKNISSKILNIPREDFDVKIYLGVTHPIQKGDPSKPYYETVCHALAQITSGALPGQIFHNSEISLTPTPNFQNIFAELVRPFGLPFSNSAFSSPKKSKTCPSRAL